MKQNKIRNIILVNVLIFVFLLTVLNFCVGQNLLVDSNDYFRPIIDNFTSKFLYKSDNSAIDISKFETEEFLAKGFEDDKDHYGEFCGQDHFLNGFKNGYTKNPIVVLGCSYTYGHGLNKEQTFSYLLSALTQRPVFNFANCGGQIIRSYNNAVNYMTGNMSEEEKNFTQGLLNHNIVDLEEEKEYKEKIYNTDYIIYIYMYDHINRYMQIEYFYSLYEDLFEPKGIEKIMSKIPLAKYIFAICRLKTTLKGYPYTDEKSSLILKKIIISTKKKLQQYMPNAKMIVLIYDEKITNNQDTNKIVFSYNKLNDKTWDELQKEEDIIVVHSKDLIGFLFDKDYKLEYDISVNWHPNEKAWEVLTPLFAEKYIK